MVRWLAVNECDNSNVGSIPTLRIKYKGYSQIGKAKVFGTLILGSSPSTPVKIGGIV